MKLKHEKLILNELKSLYSLYRNKVNATKKRSVTITFSSKYQSITLTKIMSEIEANTQ